MKEDTAILADTVYSKKRIQVHVGPATTVDGQIDLIARLDTGKTSIVKFSPRSAAKPKMSPGISCTWTHWAPNQELTGEGADLIEVLSLDSPARERPAEAPFLVHSIRPL